jgi:ABC-type transport system involved in multi-copper enzyme maturation permease subunit
VDAVRLIAMNTLRAGLRSRVAYVIVGFALILLGLTEATSRFENVVQVKMVKDFSNVILAMFGLLLTLVLSFDLLPEEVQQRTIFLVLARPVQRAQFLMGKFVGVLLLVTLLMVGLGLVHMTVLGVLRPDAASRVDMQVVQSLALLWLKLVLFAGVVVCLSSFVSRPLTLALSIFIYLFGSVSGILESTFGQTSTPALAWLTTGLQFCLPNFQNFDYGDYILYNYVLDLPAMAWLAAYAASYVALLLLATQWIFSRRDL